MRRIVLIGLVVVLVAAGGVYWFWPTAPDVGPHAMSSTEWARVGPCGLLTSDDLTETMPAPGTRPDLGRRPVERTVQFLTMTGDPVPVDTCRVATYQGSADVEISVLQGDPPETSGQSIPGLGDQVWLDEPFLVGYSGTPAVVVQRGETILVLDLAEDVKPSDRKSAARRAFARLPAEIPMDEVIGDRCGALRREASTLLPTGQVFARSLSTERAELCTYTSEQDDKVTLRLDRRPPNFLDHLDERLTEVAGLRATLPSNASDSMTVLGDRMLTVESPARGEERLRRLATAAVEEFELKPPPPTTGQGACAVLTPEEVRSFAGGSVDYGRGVIRKSVAGPEGERCEYGGNGTTVSVYSQPSEAMGLVGVDESTQEIPGLGRRAGVRFTPRGCDMAVEGEHVGLRIEAEEEECRLADGLERLARTAFERLEKFSPTPDIVVTGPCARVDRDRLSTIIGQEIRYARTVAGPGGYQCTFTASNEDLVRVDINDAPQETDYAGPTNDSSRELGGDPPSMFDASLGTIEVFDTDTKLEIHEDNYSRSTSSGWDSWKQDDLAAVARVFAVLVR